MAIAPCLIRARHINACVKAKVELGHSVESLLEHTGIPIECLRDDESLLPVRYFEHLLSRACMDSNVGAFCYSAAPRDLAAYGPLSRQVAAAETLKDAIEKSNLGATEVSQLAFRIGTGNQKTWIYADTAGYSGDTKDWQLYLLRPMLAMVRFVAGSQWWPTSILLPCKLSVEIESLDFYSRSNVQFDANVLAIEVPTQLLDSRMPRNLSDHTSKDSVEDSEIPRDFVCSLGLLLKSYVGRRSFKISELAGITGSSVRSIQRELKRSGCSYSDLIQHVRFSAAVPLLLDDRNSITDIAYDVGYSDPAHFSRAFRRYAGSAPRVFRERPEEELASIAAAAAA